MFMSLLNEPTNIRHYKNIHGMLQRIIDHTCNDQSSNLENGKKHISYFVDWLSSLCEPTIGLTRINQKYCLQKPYSKIMV